MRYFATSNKNNRQMITILIILAIIALAIFIFKKPQSVHNRRIEMMKFCDDSNGKYEMHPKYNQYREAGKSKWINF